MQAIQRKPWCSRSWIQRRSNACAEFGSSGLRFSPSMEPNQADSPIPLGCFPLPGGRWKKLKRQDPALEQQRGVLYGAALLHDLGHAPLSHTGEEMFGTHHEQWSARVIREHAQIRDSLEHYAPGTADAVADLLERGQAERGVIKSLVSSQLDCDRLDYLLRDSYSTGARYGQLDLDRILAAMTLAPDGELAIHPKGLMAVEHYLVVRNLMYRSVYNHRLNVMCNWLLERLIQEARHLGPDHVWADSTMRRWLWGCERLDLETYLANDDLRVGYHLQRWQAEAPAPLASLCDRFLNRRLLKALDVSSLQTSDRLELLAAAQTMSESAGLDPSYCCGLRQHQLHGYHPYRGGLRLWDGHNLQALEQESALVKQPGHTGRIGLVDPPPGHRRRTQGNDETRSSSFSGVNVLAMNAASPARARRVLILPPQRSCDWRQWLPDQREFLAAGSVDLDMGDWSMGCRELTELMDALAREGYTVQQVITHCATTQIGAACSWLSQQPQSQFRNPERTTETPTAPTGAET